jgi:hypothetical protein
MMSGQEMVNGLTMRKYPMPTMGAPVLENLHQWLKATIGEVESGWVNDEWRVW